MWLAARIPSCLHQLVIGFAYAEELDAVERPQERDKGFPHQVAVLGENHGRSHREKVSGDGSSRGGTWVLLAR
jgi:hypothetical protein